MRVYLVQHGEAESKEVNPDRPLSARGRLDVERIAHFLKGKLIPVHIKHSGKLRAQQTAEVIASILAPAVRVESLPGIAPMDPVEPIAQQLNEWYECTLVAGHLPFMARLVSYLLNARNEPAAVIYQPGSIVCMERDEQGQWSLAWMLRPELV